MAVFPIILCSACFVAVVLYLYFKWKYRRVIEAASKLPGPTPLPIIGNCLDFLGGPRLCHEKISQLAIEFKGLFCFWLGPFLMIVVTNPTDSKIILNSSNMLSKDLSYQFVVPYLGEGLLTAPVPMWKKYRRILNPVMHPSNIEHYIPQFNNVSRNMISDIEKKCEKRMIDPKDILYSNIVDAASETIFGGAFLGKTFKEHLLFVMEWLGTVAPLHYVH